MGPINSAQFLLNQRLLYNKAILFKYCLFFKTNSLERLMKDQHFLNDLQSMILLNPALHGRILQVSIETTLHKRYFAEDVVRGIFDKDFTIHNPYNDPIDQSIIYNSLQARTLRKQYGLIKEDITINVAPFRVNKASFNPSEIAYNKKMTGNAYPDVTIQTRPYDFKDSKDLAMAKNHIYFIDSFDLEKTCKALLVKLDYALNDKHTVKLLSAEGKMYTKKINSIIETYVHQDPQEGIDRIYKAIFKDPPPKDFKIALFIPHQKPNNEALITEENQEAINSIPLDHGHLDAVKIRKAIIGHMECFDLSTQEKIAIATHHSIRFHSSKEKEVFIPPIEEVD
jgi:hypothetical protein